MWILGLLLNLFLFYSVFDIHFKSPLVQVPIIHEGIVISGIRRIVILIGDGLRADSFFEQPHLHPHLSSLMNSEQVAWGISDTRVPTESRPGHIALFSGFHEDPSAVFTGWKENMVEFDSVLNRSTYGLALGSPDVVLMFRKGVAANKLHTEAYPSDWQDFLAANSSVLDTWVMEQFERLVRTRAIPNHDKLLIFLHLLGIDNTGHAKKPHSLEYNSNIAVVDGIVQRVEDLVESYFNDKQTLFIFTSDHGMTDWGSHGSGSKAETETPFVIWGPGIKRTIEGRLKQADFAALMAGALNIPFPTNSIGRFPSDFWTLKPFAYDALRTNFLQIHELMLVKKAHVSSNRRFTLTPYQFEHEISLKFNESYGFADSSDYESAITTLHDAINMTLEGVHYYERYDQDLLVVLVVTTSILWMTLTSFLILYNHGAMSRGLKYCSQQKFWVLAAVLSPLITKGFIGWPLWRLPYTFMPIYLARLIWASWTEGRRNGSEFPVKSLLILVILCGVGTEILVNSFHERGVLTLGLILNAFWSMKGKKLSTWQSFLWLGSVALLAFFPLAPVIGKEQNAFFMTLGPLVSGVLAFVLLRSLIPTMCRRDKLILASQTGLMISVVILIHFPSLLITRIVSWSSVIFSFLGPTFTSSSTLIIRLLSIFLGICTPFSLLSMSYESLFLPSLFFILLNVIRFEVTGENETVVSWEQFLQSSFPLDQEEDSWQEETSKSMSLSSSTRNSRQHNLHKAFRRGWFHLFFVFLSFFGTGNIGSVSSFDPTTVRCFVSIFNPFVMMVALLEKIVGPFLLVSCFFRMLLWSRLQVERNFLIVQILCQGMTLHTFFMVQSVGSWLEIGTTISHYVIVQCITLFLFLLYFSSNFLISASLLPSHIPRTRPNAPIPPPFHKTK